MGIFNRALLTIFSLVLAILFGLIFLIALLPWTTPLTYLIKALANNDQRMVLAILAAVFFLIAIKFLFSSVTVDEAPKHAIVQENKLGQINISLQAIENLVRRMVGQVNGVREIRPQVKEFPEGVSIYIKAIVTPDIKIPQVSEEIQKIVREKVFEITGVTVIDVKILIDNITNDLKARVE